MIAMQDIAQVVPYQLLGESRRQFGFKSSSFRSIHARGTAQFHRSRKIIFISIDYGWLCPFRYFLQSKKDFFRALKFADNKPESIRKLYKALIYGELGDETNLIALGLDSRRLNSYSKELIKSVHNTTALSEHTWMIYLNLREPNILMESPF